MAIIVLERRKFIRVDVSLEIRLNKEIRAFIKTLSLGGCSIHSELPKQIKNPVCIKIFSEGESFDVEGDVLYPIKDKRYSIRFNHTNKEQNLGLIKIIENIRKASVPIRATRVSLQENAVLNQKPALIINVSEGGCLMQTSVPFKYDDIVGVKFQIQREKMSLIGQVRRVVEKDIGIEFLSPSPTQVNTISRYVSLKTSSF